MSAYNWRMEKRPAIANLIVLSIAVFISACSGPTGNNENSVNKTPNSSSNQANASAKTNVEELGVLINIPYVTEDIVWKELDSNKKLIAVFRVSPADAARIVTEAEKIRPAQAVTISPESWYPAELIAQSAMSGDDTLSGRSFAANGFLQEPYKTGTITRVDTTDFFVLEVSAK